jgi:hypothetical protein
MVLFLCSTGLAQGSAKVVKRSPGEQVYRIKKGASAPVRFLLDIESGYHINSNRPADKNLIATALKLERATGLASTAVVYPKPKVRKFQFSPKPLSVYEGRVELRFNVRALPAAATGQQLLRGKLTVQACNEEACLRPSTVDVEIPIEVF